MSDIEEESVEMNEYSEEDYSDMEHGGEGSDNSDEEEDEDYEEQAKKRPRNEKGKFALPTKEEQMHLRETENLMKTNLLKLQVDEMLEEVKDESYLHKRGFVEWINTFRDAIPSLGTKLNDEINIDWLHRHGVKGLNLDSYENSKISMRYHPAVEANFIGSFVHKTATKPFLSVDIAVSMSPQCFDARDIVNFTYFDKRKLYLGVLLQQLKLPENASKFGSNMHLSCIKGDARKPIIIFKPNLKTPYLVRLYPTLPAEAEEFPLKLSQLRASKNNVRPSYWMHTLRENEKLRKEALAASSKKTKSSKKSAELSKADTYCSSHLDVSTLAPTMCYNMAILEDVSMPSMSQAINNTIQACPCIREAILLMKVWLTQRGFRDGFDSMDGHEAAVLFVYLYLSKKILPQMTPLLAFTAALKFLVETPFSTTTLSLNSRRGGSADIFASASPRPAAALVMGIGDQGIDSAAEDDMEVDGGSAAVEYNVFWRWSESSVQQLQVSARKSLELLQHNSDASDFTFVELFIRKSNFFQECDLYFHFPVLDRSAILESVNKGKVGASSESFEYELARAVDDSLCDLTPWQYATRHGHSVLRRALGERVAAIRILSAPVPAGSGYAGASILPQASINKSLYLPVWSPDAALKVSTSLETATYFVTVGVVLNTEKSHQRVIKGPSAEDEAGCEEFRSFWGPKTQLRRFHDGTIVEACVWGSDAHQTGNQVPRGEIITTEITNYILNRQLSFCCKNAIRSVCTQLEAFLPASVDLATGVVGRPDFSSSTGSKPYFPETADASTLCRRTVEAVDALRVIIISKVQGMPLQVESCRAASPSLRYSAFYPPCNHPVVLTAGGEGKTALKAHSGERISTLVHVHPVVLQMHRSGKWPAELEALRKVKTAMLIRLSENLKMQFQIHSIVSREYLDVMFRGFVFRLRMFTDNEVALLMPNALSTRPALLPAPTEDGDVTALGASAQVSAEADALVRDLVIAPLHHSAIHGTHTENPCLGDTVRLLHRWVAGHLFSGHFDHETLELIAASVFLEVQKHSDHPQSATAGFLRSLRRIAEFDWAEKPLIVDFTGGEMSAKDINYIRSQFGVSKSGISKQLPIHIVASYDKQRGYAPGYGQRRPERVVLRMIIAAARVSSDQLSEWMARGVEDTHNLCLDRIMNAPQIVSSKYNAIIKINRSVVCKSVSAGHSDGQNKWISALSGPSAFHMKLFSNLSSSELSGNTLSLRDGSTPNSIQAEFFLRLSEKFGSYALFFWDEIAGDRIGIIWKPQAFLPQKFTLLESRLRLAVTDDAKSSAVSITALNVVELMVLIVAEGDGIVETVDYL